MTTTIIFGASHIYFYIALVYVYQIFIFSIIIQMRDTKQKQLIF